AMGVGCGRTGERYRRRLRSQRYLGARAVGVWLRPRRGRLPAGLGRVQPELFPYSGSGRHVEFGVDGQGLVAVLEGPLAVAVRETGQGETFECSRLFETVAGLSGKVVSGRMVSDGVLRLTHAQYGLSQAVMGIDLKSSVAGLAADSESLVELLDGVRVAMHLAIDGAEDPKGVSFEPPLAELST